MLKSIKASKYINLKTKKTIVISRDFKKYINPTHGNVVEVGDFNPNSTPQLQALCFNILGLPALKATKSSKGKKVSTDKSVMEIWRDQYGSQFATDMINFRVTNKHRTNLLAQCQRFMISSTGRVHANIKMWGTETGRLSITQPPLQAQPASGDYSDIIKKIFIARKGFKIIGADYSQIELRIIAWRSQDPLLLDAYERGIDVHQLVEVH